MQPTPEQITEALSRVIDPELKKPVTELGMVRGVDVKGDHAAVTIALTVPGCPLRHSFEEQVQRELLPLPGIESVSLEFDVMSPEEKAALTTRLRGGVSPRTKGISLDRTTRVIAVASGKGGVGKSTLTANLAAAFARLGHRTGVLDADVYGHSIPHMLGVHQRPVVVDRMIVPPVRDELKLMSIGFFLEDNAPPGTGDVSISLGQLLPRAEVLVVTTPQPAAQQVAVRAAQMAEKTNMRLLGAVENMSYLVGSGDELFGSGGGEALAREIGVQLLAKIPLDPSLREAADRGEPLVWEQPEAEASREIVTLAERISATSREQGVGITKSLPLAGARS
jgi:ATP-binding protein involved in chromosome partitioning